MVYRGTIHGGTVVLPADVILPEGTEVLVALPNRRAEPTPRPVTGEASAELDRIAEESPTSWPPGPAGPPATASDRPRGQPGPLEDLHRGRIADFLSPTEYDWSEDVYTAEEAVRAYLSDFHADH